ncbi:hypothetical protein NITHO_3560003 [Nitrolancea hollandica Lb]|uniref:Uncharacterized protein n=1 Tax=Nitrolancea hollandica Lb TaxID=1129897 RepID=I4EIM4_9BACT|nr:hypothetical protein NITHO_3560003 [Nitrolancea hollandica Lb]
MPRITVSFRAAAVIFMDSMAGKAVNLEQFGCRQRLLIVFARRLRVLLVESTVDRTPGLALHLPRLSRTQEPSAVATNIHWHVLFSDAPRSRSGGTDQMSALTVAGGMAVGGF